MLIDFNQIEAIRGPGMNHGSGEMSAQVFDCEQGKFVITRIHPFGSIGIHEQKLGDDINYVISGTGTAYVDGKEEALYPVCAHLCPKGSRHKIMNTGIDDLLLCTAIVDRG